MSDESSFSVVNPLPKIKPKGSFAVFANEQIISKQLVDYVISNFPNYTALKFDIAFLEHILNLIENLLKKNSTIDKNIVVIKIFNTLFGFINSNEESALKNQIEYIINNKLVRKIPTVKKAMKYFKKQFPKL